MQAFERDLLALVPRLRRFARSLARDAADADDLIQVALERALRARDQWMPGTRLDAWMMRIVRNCWIDEARARARRNRTFVEEEAGATIASDAHHDVERRAELRDVDRAMATLPDEQREVIALILVEGMAYREAADLLDIPIGTLTSRLTRGRQALVRMLEAA
ncbi:sigma-70 family RNA polymerase sigma factor [Sphingosinicella sp.]|uniref:sigma-70 family RNA polymerase sigma factor n=1 Tax=Sphingosinicella sp. TaxID=1917971 RepID=UPI004038069D